MSMYCWWEIRLNDFLTLLYSISTLVSQSFLKHQRNVIFFGLGKLHYLDTSVRTWEHMMKTYFWIVSLSANVRGLIVTL